MTKISFVIPIKTVSESNCSDHWTKKAKRHKAQQFFVRSYFSKVTEKISFPCLITLTRLSSRTLDDDNLVSSMKYIRDEISECLLPEKRGYYQKNGKNIAIKGRADSDSRLLWKYHQEKEKIDGVKVEIIFLESQ